MMDANEIMMNDEVTEAVEAATEAITDKSSGNFGVAAIGGAITLIGGLVVQYVVIPTVGKLLAKRKKKNSDEVVDADAVEVNGEENDSEKTTRKK